MARPAEPQTSSSVLMIRPARFQSNPQTAESNRFQQQDYSSTDDGDHEKALVEFDNLVATLEAVGIEVVVFDDTQEPHTPDSIFPNNWLSMHADGTVVLYPMMASNRRPERRADILGSLSSDHGFRIEQSIDLSLFEAEEKYLEGTGSIVLDRQNHIAYACLSARTDADLLGEFARRMDYEMVVFAAAGEDGAAIYHTNVMMCIGVDFAVVCSASIKEEQRQAVLDRLQGAGYEVVDISYTQMASFAGNMLELKSANGGRILAMSSQALNSLTAEQRKTLSRRTHIVAASIDSIEKSSGGSVRCMLAEIHLPRNPGSRDSE
ncbi:MAG: arginine deiminase-related protein [Gammaproteobacteria bacterium]|nr:arginine deiminase-related protein [Gammaproteobacteria bacterium]